VLAAALAITISQEGQLTTNQHTSSVCYDAGQAPHAAHFVAVRASNVKLRLGVLPPATAVCINELHGNASNIQCSFRGAPIYLLYSPSSVDWFSQLVFTDPGSVPNIADKQGC